MYWRFCPAEELSVARSFQLLVLLTTSETVLSDTPAVLATSRIPTMVCSPVSTSWITDDQCTRTGLSRCYSALEESVMIPARNTMTMAEGNSR